MVFDTKNLLNFRFKKKDFFQIKIKMENLRVKEELIMFNNNTEVQKSKRGSLQLWQFLLQLLSSKENISIIEWTKKNAAEFKLLDPEEVYYKYIKLNVYHVIKFVFFF
jgi:hypothetical protein